MLSQEAANHLVANNKLAQATHDPLNEHNYCSPNTEDNNNRQQQQKQHKQQQGNESTPNLENKTTNMMTNNILANNSTNQTDIEVKPSTSTPQTSPTKVITSVPRSVIQSAATLNLNRPLMDNDHDDGNLSDSSSSISTSSSNADKGLVIVQEQTSKPKSVVISARAGAINETGSPTVVKRKPGRPPKRNPSDSLQNQITPLQARAKRPRQNTSVTDKSQWIMGEEQIDSILSEDQILEDQPEKRKRVMSRDSDHLYDEDLSSDYTTSDGDSDDSNDDGDSEDDPDRLWCICQKPHDGKFMICCDVCKDWFHGVCVGVTKLMGDRIEKEGKEWFCQECTDKMKSGIPRNAIPNKSIKKDKKKKKKSKPESTGKRRPGRPRKSEIETRSSSKNIRKSLDSKLGIDNGRLKRNLGRPEARIETFDEFEDSQRLKVLIKERKKEFFYKRQLAEQQKAAKRNELGIGRRSITANLSDSLDSLASSTNTPNMNNLPINIKSEHSKQRSKPNIVLQINTKKELNSDHASPRIVTAIMRSPRELHNSDTNSGSSVNDLFTAEPIQICKKPKQPTTSTSSSHITSPTELTHELASHSIDKKPHQTPSASHTSKQNDKPSGDQPNEHPTPHKKKRKDSDSISNGSNQDKSTFFCQKLRDTLESRRKSIKDLVVSPDRIETLAKEVEAQLCECYEKNSSKYQTKFRSLIFNLQDQKNHCLITNVLNGDIPPSRLVRMSSDEMASTELAKWRERENKHSLELIKRDAELAAQQVIVKKTHKGEEVIAAPSINDPDDPTAEVDNQEPPTTPVKGPKEPFTKSTPESANNQFSGGDLDSKKSPLTPNGETSPAKDLESQVVAQGTSHEIEQTDSNIAPKVESTDESSSNTGDQTSLKEVHTPNQPKRFSVTIETSLKPANLTRLKEPLIKPIEKTDKDDKNSNLSPSQHEWSVLDAAPIEPDADNLEYDPESSVPGLEDAKPKADLSIRQEVQSISGSVQWSGSIYMPDVARFRAFARVVEGDPKLVSKEISKDLTVCGRIAPDQVQGYIKKIRPTNNYHFIIVELRPEQPEDKDNFNSFFDYLYTRNRYGVIQTNPQILRDFYLIPLHERSSIPEVLKPMRVDSIDRKSNNCVLGLMVRPKRNMKV